MSAFALLSGWFALRGSRPALARAWLLAVLLAGLAFGAAQMLRGAHYASHTLWTAWFCWLICALGARLWAPDVQLRLAGAAPPRERALHVGAP